MVDLESYAHSFPMAPMGGVFFALMGVFVATGAVVFRQRQSLIWIGLATGGLSFMFTWPLAARLPAPSGLQVGSLALAIAAEIAAFRILMPRTRPDDERGRAALSLGIVGIHFFIMAPAFGPLVVALAVLCTANAALAWRAGGYSLRAAWGIDGGVKLAAGIAMLLTSPLLRR